MEIGKIIKYERQKAGLTQNELGKLLNVSGSMIGQYETGARNPKPKTIRKIFSALNVPYSVLDSNNAIIKTENNTFDKVQLSIIKEIAETAIINYHNLRPSAFMPSKKQTEILKMIVDICNQNI